MQLPPSLERTRDTARLALEPLAPAHAALVYPHLREAALYTYIPQDPPGSLEEVVARYRRLASRRSPDGSELWLNWAARLRSTGEYVGLFEATVRQGVADRDAGPTAEEGEGLADRNVRPTGADGEGAADQEDRPSGGGGERGTALIAYMVFAPYQGRGYAAEGCRSVLAFLAAECGVLRVAAEIDTRNAASVALVESLGFARVALRKDADHFKGASSDEYRYERDLA